MSEHFKNLIRNTINFDSHAKQKVFENIPDEIFDNILKVNFNNDIELAKNILTNDLDSIKRDDLDKEIKSIKNYKESIDLFSEYLESDKKIILVTDTDNDGTSAQAIAKTFVRGYKDKFGFAPNMDVIFAQYYDNNPVRGITVDVVNSWVELNNINKNDDFLVVTADNGISSKEEQEKILNTYPNAKVLITDHHTPHPEHVAFDSDRSLVLDPKVEPKGYFIEKNISGAHVFGELLKGVEGNLKLEFDSKFIEYIDSISHYSNLLDYVSSDIRLKPLKEYEISKYSQIGVLLNVNNSLSKIITNSVTDLDVEGLKKDLPDLDIEKLKDVFSRIREQNVVAYKLLKLENDYDPEINSDFNTDFVMSLAKVEDISDDFDFNHVSKLRSYILDMNVNEEKTQYETDLAEAMLDVFKNLKNYEKEILNEIREFELVDNIKRDYVDFMIPKSGLINKVFNRKFLNKAYNVSNNGFIMFVSENKPDVISGSFRSQYDIDNILYNKAKIEKELKIKMEVLGHARAAGFYIYPEEGTSLNPNTIELLSNKINESIDEINQKRKLDNTKFIETDFETLDLFDEINKKVRANVRNVESLPILLKIKADTYFTDSYTAEIKGMNDVLKDSKYGYSVVPLNFHGKALIVPNEIARESQKSNYSSYLFTTYMDTGAFMVSGVSRFVNPKNVVQLKTAKEHREHLLNFYKDFYLKNDDKESAENYSVMLSNDDLKNIPFYTNNKYGNSDFRNVESIIISILDNTKQDEYSICDVEATGLGQSPKLTNIGFLNFSIDKKSGKKIKETTYKKCVFSTINNKEYYIPTNEFSKLKKIYPEEFSDLEAKAKKNILINSKGERFIPDKGIKITRIFNKITDGDSVVLNRQLVGESIAMLIKDRDTKVSPNLASLTNIDNRMLNAAGISNLVADKVLLEKFKDKNIIFETHNGLNYDGNVILSNLPDFSKYYTESLQADSILFSKEYKLAYDDVNVTIFSGIPELNRIFFYCDEYSDFSLKEFLASKEDGFYPDYSGKHMMKKEGENLYIINKEKNEINLISVKRDKMLKEIEYAIEKNKLETIAQDLSEDEREDVLLSKEKFEDIDKLIALGSPYKNYRKYSVVKLAEQQMVRNLLLDDLPDIKYIKPFDYFTDDLKNIWDNFIIYYHFDKSPSSNMYSFFSYLRDSGKEDDLSLFRANISDFLSLTEDFIEENKEVHERFKESWVVKRILEKYDPEKDTPISDDRVSLVNWETGIPETKIKDYLNLIINFKKKYNLDEFYVEEKHNNIIHKLEGTPYENIKDIGLGDVILEGQVAINLNNNRNANSYNIQDKRALSVMLDTIKDSSTKMLKSDLITTQLNSFSRRQAAQYKRRKYTDKISSALDLDEYKVKLGEKIIPQGTFIKFEKNPEEVNDFDAEKFVEDIKFLVSYRLMLNSSSSKFDSADYKDYDFGEYNKYISEGEKSVDSPISIFFKANNNLYEEKLKEIYEKYGNFYFSKAGVENKKMYDAIASICVDGGSKTKKFQFSYMEDNDKEKYNKYIDKVIKFMEKMKVDSSAEYAMFASQAEDYVEMVLSEALPARSEVKSGDELDFRVATKKMDVGKFIVENFQEVSRPLLIDSLELSYTKEVKNKNIKRKRP